MDTVINSPERPGQERGGAPERGLVDLSREECLGLLRTGTVGRLAVVVDGHPDLFPVNYGVAEDGSMVIRTDPGTKLANGTQWWVAFEVDDVDPGTRSGWSVVVKGLAFDVTETIDARSVALQGLTLDTWAPGPRARRLAVAPEVVTGRRLSPPPGPVPGK